MVGKPGGRGRQVRAHSLNDKHKAERGRLDMGQGYKHPKATLSDLLPPARHTFLTSPDGTTNRRPSVQPPQPMESILTQTMAVSIAL